MSELAYSEVKITNVINWSERLRHGFALRFEDRLKRICHECGEAGTGNSMFEVRISKEQTSKEDIQKIIEDLDWFAKNVD
jgi:rRNA maturation endonuclease Nob1